MQKQLLIERANEYKKQHWAQNTHIIHHFAKRPDPFIVSLNGWLTSKEITALPGTADLSLSMFIQYLIQTSSYKKIYKYEYGIDKPLAPQEPVEMYFMSEYHQSHCKDSVKFFKSIFADATAYQVLNKYNTFFLLRYLAKHELLNEELLQLAKTEWYKNEGKNNVLVYMMNNYLYAGILHHDTIKYICAHKDIFVDLFYSPPYYRLCEETKKYDDPEHLKKTLLNVIDIIDNNPNEHPRMIDARIAKMIIAENDSYTTPVNTTTLKR